MALSESGSRLEEPSPTFLITSDLLECCSSTGRWWEAANYSGTSGYYRERERCFHALSRAVVQRQTPSAKHCPSASETYEPENTLLLVRRTAVGL